jgi:hypothetical protein
MIITQAQAEGLAKLVDIYPQRRTRGELDVPANTLASLERMGFAKRYVTGHWRATLAGVKNLPHCDYEVKRDA